jgi:biotin carboxyl carrier protein
VAVLEAMKMENDLYAPSTGRISKINFQPGQNVLEDEVVLTVE